MKFIFIVSAFLILGTSSIGQTTGETNKAAYKSAMQTMKSVESNLLKEKKDLKAVKLITSAKGATIASYEYLTSHPGYEPAVLASLENKTTLKEFKKKVKSEDEKYIALAKKAEDVQTTKKDYLISISPEYKKSWADYSIARSVKKKKK